MSDIVMAMIDRLRVWCGDGWKTYDINKNKKANFILRIRYDQLFLLYDNNVLETLNLNGKMKGIYKDDVLILIICSHQQVRKIKFQIKTNIEQCLHKLSLHLPLVNYNAMQRSHPMKYRNIDEVLKTALSGKEVLGAVTGSPLPSSLNDFVKVCLLDPVFLQVVDGTEKILKNIMS